MRVCVYVCECVCVCVCERENQTEFADIYNPVLTNSFQCVCARVYR